MQSSIAQMTREKLLAEMPKRTLVFALALTGVGIAISLVVSVLIPPASDSLRLVVLFGSLLIAPIVLRPLARWTLQPIHERIRRRQELAVESRKNFLFRGGDFRV